MTEEEADLSVFLNTHREEIIDWINNNVKTQCFFNNDEKNACYF
jgi:hypothetical protein